MKAQIGAKTRIQGATEPFFIVRMKIRVDGDLVGETAGDALMRDLIPHKQNALKDRRRFGRGRSFFSDYLSL
jgi:hypothetical protein